MYRRRHFCQIDPVFSCRCDIAMYEKFAKEDQDHIDHFTRQRNENQAKVRELKKRLEKLLKCKKIMEGSAA